MRISAITSSQNGNYRGKNNPYFKGKTHTVLVNVKNQDNKRNFFTEDDKIYLLQRQSLVNGNKPLEPVKGACEPDYMLIGKVYYADWNEWPSDRVYDEHTAVVADTNTMDFTKERVETPNEDNPDVLYAQIVSLRESIAYQEARRQGALRKVDEIDEETNGVFKDPKFAPRNDELALQGRKRRKLLYISERRGERLEELKEMKSIVSRNFVNIMQDMQSKNYNYYTDNKGKNSDLDEYYVKLREQLFMEVEEAEKEGRGGETGFDFLIEESST